MKTGKAYKVFRFKDGKLYPPMVANPDGAPTPVGEWLDAQDSPIVGKSKTGRDQVKSTRGGTLAHRPGWHMGDLPRASQFDRGAKSGNPKFPADFVWAEAEYPMDKDYQSEAESYGMTPNGKFRHAYAGLPYVPKGGYYRYRTNPDPKTIPWVISGAMRVNRLLPDDEVARILTENGIEPIEREGGNKTLEELGLGEYDVNNLFGRKIK